MRRHSRESKRSSLAVSLAIHAIVIVALATMTFRYPIEAFLGMDREHVRPELIRYMRLPPPGGAIGNGAAEKATPRRRSATPALLFAPRMIPTSIPPVPSPSTTSGAVSGRAGGKGGAGVGLATGVEPAPMDPRLYAPNVFIPVPKTAAQRLDSAVKDAFQTYYDSAMVAAANPQRKPGDWTTTDKNGNRWGWDPTGIRLGKFMIPNAVLAALPLKNVTNGTSPIEQRQTNYIRQSVLEHAQQSISEDEFREAVRRIRERKEREKKEQEKEKAKPIADGGR